MTFVSFLYAFWLLMVHLFVGNFLPALKNKPKTEVKYQYQQIKGHANEYFKGIS